MNNNKLFLSLSEYILDGVAYCQLILDNQNIPTDFKFLKVNEIFEKLTGIHGIIENNASVVIPSIKSANRPLFDKFAQVALAGASSKPIRFETYINPLNRWFLITVYSLERYSFVAIFQDITQSKLMELRLKDANKSARKALNDLSIEKTKVEIAKAKDDAILESTGEGLIALDNSGKIIVINKVATDILGWKVKDLIGKKITGLTLQDEAGQLIPFEKRPTTRALVTGSIVSVNYFFVRSDKSRFPIAITATPIKLNGKTIGLIEVIRDITKENEIDKAKTEFASLVSHQLRTPFSTINWYVEVLLSGDIGGLNKKQKDYLTEVYNASKRMVELINELLSISRIEMKVVGEKDVLIDIKVLVDTILKDNLVAIKEKSLVFKKTYAINIPKLEANPRQVSMIFQNLLSNAIKYTPNGGRVNLSIAHKDQDLLISVTDSGMGIPKDSATKIFNRFYRAENAKEYVPEGAGLGLYIVKSVVEIMGGKIWFNSKVNKGSNFYVLLPVKLATAKTKKITL